MEKDELIRRLMKTFVGELEEHARAFDRGLLELERRPDAPARAEIFKSLLRTAHSLKGAARSVNVTVLEAAGHRLESIIAVMRDRRIESAPELFKLLFATVDAIKESAGRLSAGEEVGESQFAALLARLETAGDEPETGQAPPADAPGFGARAAAAVPESAIAAADDSPANTPRDGAVRISAAKLDHLLALGGELLVARRRAESRGADVDRLLEVTKRWETEWRAAKTAMRLEQRQASPADVPPPATQPHRASVQWIERTEENLRWLRRQLDELVAGLAADSKALDQVAAPLEAELLRARMVPFAWACEGFERAVRDLAQSAGKDVDLIIRGGEIEIDRSVVEGIKDPLLHLVRNAVGHGIETPEARAAVGKTPRGRITMGAALRNGRVEITVADDGGGFDVAAIRDRAGQSGLAVPDSEQQVVLLAFAPGLSTSPMITEISGRGVGLDVVKTAVEAQGGGVDISFEPGAETRVVLTVPLSLTRIPALLVSAGGQTYAFDSAAVRGLMRIGTEELRTMEGRDVLTMDGAPVPVFSLTEVLGQPAHETPRHGDKLPVVILGSGTERAAFTVGDLLVEQEVVVKDLGPRLPRVRNVTGATILSTGRIALILNAADLVRTALGRAPHRVVSAALAERSTEQAKRLLVVDDSVTTRTLMKSILEAAGYEVTAAVDGVEAWQVLLEQEADLVVSDVEMPRMDGFELTETIRSSKRLRNLPVVLVTARETEEDKLRGLQAGADAYLLKSAFDQTSLIQVIGQIL
jgi:two-component system chemotaxis sensor kinase CheA